MVALNIRSATPRDAAEMVAVHYASVHSIKHGACSLEVLDAWSPMPSESRVSWLGGLVASSSTISCVAESESGEILAFCFVLTDQCQLKALYVHPSWSRRGVGRALLEHTQHACSAAGVKRLELNASFNAEGFYAAAGYESLGPAFQPLTDSCSMGAVRMSKSISAAV